MTRSRATLSRVHKKPDNTESRLSIVAPPSRLKVANQVAQGRAITPPKILERERRTETRHRSQPSAAPARRAAVEALVAAAVADHDRAAVGAAGGVGLGGEGDPGAAEIER